MARRIVLYTDTGAVYDVTLQLQIGTAILFALALATIGYALWRLGERDEEIERLRRALNRHERDASNAEAEYGANHG